MTTFPAAESSTMLDSTELFSSTLDQFLAQVSQMPEATAILFEDQCLSYQQLDDLANRFASALTQLGASFGQTVGLCIDRTPQAIAAMLGAFKLGAVFVPLDPEYPLERIRFMIEDAAIRIVITHDASRNALAVMLKDEAELTWIDSASETFATIETSVHRTRLSPSDLAYIMYTSGSTGKPKGVQIEHLSLTTYCAADIEIYQLTPADRTLQFSTLNFDIAIEEIFPPLLSGGCVVVRPRERSTDANELSTIVRQYEVTALHLATAYWHEWVDLMKATSDRVPQSLRMVLATGEKVSVEHYRRWLSLCDHEILWCNAYGPTETTVTATVFIPDSNFSGDHMPIGKPLAGYRAYILDEHNNVLGAQETGLLYIAGPALARGYLNRPDLTEKAFVTVDLPDEGPTRLYRTGDLARWLPDGNIDFAGRVDHQIKLGSYRIEPGEIEAVLSKHPQVRDSIVIYDQVDAQKHLIAYVAADDNPSVESVANYLREHLPAYMVPARYVLLDALPKTINGKIDRAALPSPTTSRTVASDHYVAPRDAMEERLCELWRKVLQVPLVGIHDDFFALGGSSLLVTRVVAELTREFAIQLPVRDFFANPTVASAARHLKMLTGQSQTVDLSLLHSDQAALRKRLPRIHADFIVGGKHQLFSVRYEPPTGVVRRHHAVVMCHPYGHEYTRAYRNLQQLAIQLAGEGFDVMRFDYQGTGNSGGSSVHCCAESFKEDVRRAALRLSELTGAHKLSLLGIRLGATLVALPPVDPIESLVLWDPIASGVSMLETFRRLHEYALTSQTRFSRLVTDAEDRQIFGHQYSREKQASLELLELPASCPAKHLVVTSKGYRQNDPELAQRLEGWNVVDVADEIYWQRPEFTESAFASPEAARAIVEFLKGGK